jgi:hypothetical protein
MNRLRDAGRPGRFCAMGYVGGRTLRARAAAALLAATLAACRGAPEVSDTGYVGSWEREIRGGRSVISLWEAEGELRLRWNKTPDPEFASAGTFSTVRCGTSGPCTEFAGQAPVYEYTFRTFRREGQDDLFVECVGEPAAPGVSRLQYVDRLELQPGGLELWSYMVELNGAPRESLPIKHRKVSNDPF